MNFSYKISLFNILALILFIFAMYTACRTEGEFLLYGVVLFFGIFVPILLLIIDFGFQYVIKSKLTVLFLEMIVSVIGGLLIYLYVSLLNLLN